MKLPCPKRIGIGLLTGAVLGVICIIGVGTRLGFSGNMLYLLGMWYNRVVMGLIVGLSEEIVLVEENSNYNIILRGAIIGLVVTTAIFFVNKLQGYSFFFRRNFIWDSY